MFNWVLIFKYYKMLASLLDVITPSYCVDDRLTFSCPEVPRWLSTLPFKRVWRLYHPPLGGDGLQPDRYIEFSSQVVGTVRIKMRNSHRKLTSKILHEQLILITIYVAGDYGYIHITCKCPESMSARRDLLYVEFIDHDIEELQNHLMSVIEEIE